ncbi:MAG: FAD-dependent oxidoreductase [Alphaproteobacteria bacterium]|nr:FAD-dependent oxidoreductase [Alphaproteobacteria bacterium]
MSDRIEADLCVIGGGSGGLSVAAGAAQMGASVVLVEKGRMGGDCLNYGCVPSKALLAAGHAAQRVRGAGRFGVQAGQPTVDYAAVHDHVHDVIASIAPHDSVERFEGLGVRVIQAAGRFTGPREVEAGGLRIRARRFVLATGSAPLVPPIPGLDQVPYLTNETIFERKEAPSHLLVLGGGPIGLEMAQAHRRLGCKVTVVEAVEIMNKDDPELVEVARRRLLAEGVDIREFAKVTRASRTASGVALHYDEGGHEQKVEGSHLLVAVGRRPNLDGLGLEEAGIAYERRGVSVDRRLRTSNRRVFAIGDAAGPYLFTHMAGYHAGIVIRNALFRLPARVDYRAVPWVTFTDPEVAQVGLTEREARAQGIDVRLARASFAENDRARAERETEGLVKVVLSPKGRVLGCGIAGAHAGELLLPWCLAVARQMKIGEMAGVIAPYPTLSEVSKRAAGAHFTPTLFGPKVRRIVRFLRLFG